MTKRNLALMIMVVVLLAFGILTLTRGGGSVTAREAWARTSPMMQSAAAAYMVLEGGAEDDAVVGVSVPGSVAASAELHETRMSGGTASMHHIDRIEVPAGETVPLEPGGLHVMLLELASPLEVGQRIELTLQLAGGDSLVVEAEVRENP